jgi:aryl-alcohol dehydrogenase-like predicted oxidoreductase
VVVATKAGLGGAGKRPTADTSRRGVLRSLDESLDRLGLDHVDLLQVQLWVDEVPLEETLAALDDAVASGRARYVGVSNFSGWQTALAATWQRAWPDRTPLASTQVEYSLLNRRVEREVLPAAAELGLGVLAWSPLGRGVLSGKYRTGTPADSRGASPHLESFVRPYLVEESALIVEAVCKAADGLGLSPVEVALAWLRDRPGVTAPILGARTAAQLRGALTVVDVCLPAEIVAALDDVSAVDLGYPER